MKAAAENVERDLRIEVDLGRSVIVANDDLSRIDNIRVAEFLYHLIRKAPNVLSYQEIREHILRPHDISQLPVQDSDGYIRKLKLKACRVLQKATSQPSGTIVVTVRSVGYRLGDGWRTVDVGEGSLPKDLQSTLTELGKICSQAISVMHDLDLTSTNEGDIVLSREGREKDVEDMTQRYVALAKSLMDRLPSSLPALARKHLRVVLETMLSYVQMARVGRGISESVWRDLYVAELNVHLQVFAQSVEGAWRSSS